jgi:hypothetical protein
MGNINNDFRLIIIARYWNDIEWINASLDQVDYWDADEIYICEGNWDKKFAARSTDGTRCICEEWVSIRGNAFLFDNLRDHNNYRFNQANTCNAIMKKANIKPGDWVMVVDCDHFYFKQDIDTVKNTMGTKGHEFDYPVYNIYNFLDGIDGYYESVDDNAAKLPYKVVEGMHWIPTCHPAIGNSMYCKVNKLIGLNINIFACHYVLARLPERLDSKYKIGDRKTPQEWGGGVMMRNLKKYNSVAHPVFAVSTLKKLGFEI